MCIKPRLLWYCLKVLLLSAAVEGFPGHGRFDGVNRSAAKRAESIGMPLAASKKIDNEGSNFDTLIETDLRRPLVNLKKESILFSENPSTIDDNEFLRIWMFCKKNLPYVLTGCQPHDTTANDNPLAGIYNMLLVRLPTMLAGVVYAKNLAQGHPLVVDMGDGPFVVNPVVVFGALYAILR